MKMSLIKSSLIVMILLLVMIVPVAAVDYTLPTISSISPTVGYTGTSPYITITGTGLTNFGTDDDVITVKLVQDDEKIVGSSCTYADTSIVCKFSLSSSKSTGDWDVVLVNGTDDANVEKSSAFDLRTAIAISSISPTTGVANDDDLDFTLAGTGLSDIVQVYLYNSDYSNITASADDTTSTKVTGTFDLSDATEDTYKLCVKDSAGTRKCNGDVTFDVTTDQVGSIDLSSSPSGASVYVDNTLKGTTPLVVEDLTEGSHKVLISKSGYTDWGKMIKVVADSTTTVDADLAEISTQATVAQTAATPIPTVPTATARTTKVSTIKVPTTWPSTAVTTQASPVELLGIVGAVGFAFYVLRK
jgi:hypothetical protein